VLRREGMVLIAQRAEVDGAAFAVFVVIYLVFLVFAIIATVKIVTKAGYSGWWVLIGLVPVANIVFYFIFAFSEWPVLRELADARTALRSAPPQESGSAPLVPPPPPTG
jgi:predicted lysophospholipase L1 biosynthesis ABC-type transport system permease subunit